MRFRRAPSPGNGGSREVAGVCPGRDEDLLSMQYGDKRLFALLSLLFTFVDLRNQFTLTMSSRYRASRRRG
jgi:hypothetical protein